MKIAVFGNKRETVEQVIKKLEQKYKTEAVKPKLGKEHPIIEMAKETYGQNKRKNVIYDGCVFEFLFGVEDENLFDVYEQIVLTSLVNIDKVYVVNSGIEDETISFVKEYVEMVDKDKIVFVSHEDEII